MKTRVGLALALLAAFPVQAGAEDVEAVAATPELTEDYLDTLLGPLALHPDVLVALILPASTVPTDIVLAARFLRSGGKIATGSEPGWDDSVLGLARYPEIVYWLDEELTWTVDVGHAFMADPAAVMNAIQRLRARASAAGTLSSTHQQRVVVENEIISIVPTSTRVIYIPTYDPLVVYSPLYDHRPSVHLRFGFGRPIGSWLRYDCDWWGRRIWHFDGARRDRSEWDRRRHNFRAGHPAIPGARPWQPRPRDLGWRQPHRREVAHVERPRFDAEPPSRARIRERQGSERPEISRPEITPRGDNPRRERDVRSRENPGRVVERRVPRVERDSRPRQPATRMVERETRPRVAPPPTVNRPASNPPPRRSATVNTRPPPAPPPPVSAPPTVVVPPPRIAPAPSAPANTAPQDRGRSSRERNER